MYKVGDATVYTDFSGLAQLKTQARENSREAVEQVAAQFESLFLNRVLQSMRQAKLADGIFDSQQSEFYRDMYDQQLALHLAGEPGIGLAKLIANQLSPSAQTSQKKWELDDYFKHAVASGQRSIRRETLASEQTVTTSEVEQTKASPANTFDSQRHFVDELLPLAKQAAEELGVEPKVLLAQSALETGWGKFVIKRADGTSSFNLFNIKAGSSWQGPKVGVSTLEYTQGVGHKEQAAFRVYESFQESFNDYVNLLKRSPRYQQALQATSDPDQYLQQLQQAGYATDPHYAEKVLAILDSDAVANAGDTLTLAQIE